MGSMGNESEFATVEKRVSPEDGARSGSVFDIYQGRKAFERLAIGHVRQSRGEIPE